jgi:hypothetical protein
LFRGTVEKFEEDCEALLGSKPFVEIAVGFLCFFEGAELRKRLLHNEV